MSMKTAMQSAPINKLTSAQLIALVSYCLTVNIACPDLTIGEVHEFVTANGKRPVTIQRTQRALTNMIEDGMAGKRIDTSRAGKKMHYRYYPLEKSVRLCIAYSDFLPSKLKTFTDALFENTHISISAAMGYISAQNKVINGSITPVDFAQQSIAWQEVQND
jgi:hypothetical protein